MQLSQRQRRGEKNNSTKRTQDAIKQRIRSTLLSLHYIVFLLLGPQLSFNLWAAVSDRVEQKQMEFIPHTHPKELEIKGRLTSCVNEWKMQIA